MKKPILLLQFRTDQTLEHEQKCIIENGKFMRENLETINVLDTSHKLPKPRDLDKYCGVIIGASAELNITDWSSDAKTKVENIYPLIDKILKRDIPTLAICFGHQLVLQHLGGKIERNQSQSEAGTFEITLNNNGKTSPLFEGLPEKFYVVQAHKDSVTVLPKNIKLLASSERHKFQACRIKQNIFTVQFHPELDREGLSWRLSLYPDYIKGKSLEKIKNSYEEIPYAHKIISNFENIVLGNGLNH